MQTQLITKSENTTARLERESPDGGPVEQIPLSSFPFTVGRVDTVDLQVDSARVSRQHAVIVAEKGVYRLVDSGSTNGTFVNGQRVQEAVLQDGDLVVFADVEFCFQTSNPAPRESATQVISSGDTSSLDLIREVRRLHEMITHRCVENLFQPIVNLEKNSVYAYTLTDLSDGGGHAQVGRRNVVPSECPLVERHYRFQARLAAEEAAQLPGKAGIFLKLDHTDLTAERIDEALGPLTEALPPQKRLVIDIADEFASDTPQFRSFHERVQDLGVGLAYSGFAQGQFQVKEWREIPPDFLKFAPNVIRSVHRSSGRHRQIESVIDAVRQIGCEAVATGIVNEADNNVARELGCQLAQGRYYSPPMTLEAAFVQAKQWKEQGFQPADDGPSTSDEPEN